MYRTVTVANKRSYDRVQVRIKESVLNILLLSIFLTRGHVNLFCITALLFGLRPLFNISSIPSFFTHCYF